MKMKTYEELIKHCIAAKDWKYVYGAKGTVLNKAQIQALINMYPSCSPATDINKAGYVCCDCSGLISSCTKIARGSQEYHDTALVTEPIANYKANPSKYKGWAVWMKGHIGVADGEGGYYAMDGSARNWKHYPLSMNKFTHVLKLKDIDYTVKATVQATTKTTTTAASTTATTDNFDYSAIFDATYYSNKYADLKRVFGTDKTKLYNHFKEHGIAEGRQAKFNFDFNYYKAKYADLRNAFGKDNKLYYRHFITNGIKERRYGANYALYNGTDYSLVYDKNYYLDHNADLKRKLGDNPEALIKHFVEYGMKEGRQACATFNVKVYRSKYSDLQKAFGTDLVQYYKHYMSNGYKEKRVAV